MSQKLNSAIAVIGIDIGKNSFHVVGLDCVLTAGEPRRSRRAKCANDAKARFKRTLTAQAFGIT